MRRKSIEEYERQSKRFETAANAILNKNYRGRYGTLLHASNVAYQKAYKMRKRKEEYNKRKAQGLTTG